MRGISLKRGECYLYLKTLPALISLSCKLVPVHYREYEDGLMLVGNLNYTHNRDQPGRGSSFISPLGETKSKLDLFRWKSLPHGAFIVFIRILNLNVL